MGKNYVVVLLDQCNNFSVMKWDHIYMFILYHNAYLELEQLYVFYLFQGDEPEP